MNYKKFSLIEFLIVTAIFAILLSLLQPTFAKIMDKAHTAQCQSNLSKIGIALAAYLEDYAGFYPTLRHGALLSGKAGQVLKTPTEKRKLNAYLSNHQTISQCPSDLGDVTNFGSNHYNIGTASNCYEDYGTSYLSASNNNRGAISYVFHHKTPKNIYQMDHLDNKLITADFPWGRGRSAVDEETRWHGGDHTRILNILFGDGHVSLVDFTLEYEEKKDVMRPNKKWIIW